MRTKHILTMMLAVLMVSSVFIPAVDADNTAGIGLNASIKEPRPDIAISVDVDHIDFGELLPGETSASYPVGVANIGLQAIKVTATVEDAGSEAIFVPGITVDGVAWDQYSSVLPSDDNGSLGVALEIPGDVSTRGAISGSLTVWAGSAESPAEDFLYTIDEGTVTIDEYIGPGGDVVIPSQIEGLPVTAIGSYAFDENANVISVVIPDGVTRIGNYAFRECAVLASVVIPDSVTSIGNSVFSDSTALAAVSIGNGIDYITYKAFYGCTALTSVTIPDSVTFIGMSAFEGCTALASVTVGRGLTDLGSYAFCDCTALTSLVFNGDAPSWVADDWADGATSITVYYHPGAAGFTTPEWAGVPCYPLPTEESWELFQGNQQLNGYYAGETPDSNDLKWVSDAIDAKPSSSVVIAEGKVFVYCFNETEEKSYLAALNLADGTLAWREECTVSNTLGSWATPAYHDGLVFIHGSPARHASDGTPAWPDGRYLPDNTNGGPMIAEGKVFIGNWDGHQFFAFDEKTGEELWNITVSGYAQGTPAYHDGKLFLTSYMGGGGHVYCVNAADGTSVWYAPVSQYTCGSPCVAGGYVYVTTYNFDFGDAFGDLVCLYESNGTVAWSQPIQRSDSTPTVVDGRVYVTGGCYWLSEHQTYCFDAADGTPIWATDPEDEIGGWTSSVVVSADGKLFVGEEGPWFTGLDANYLKLFALDIADGTVLWEAENGGATVAIHDGVVFTAGADGRIYAYGPA